MSDGTTNTYKTFFDAKMDNPSLRIILRFVRPEWYSSPFVVSLTADELKKG